MVQTNANGNGLTEANGVVQTNANGNGLSIQEIPNVADKVSLSPSSEAGNLSAWVDESCNGKGSPNAGLVLPILAVIGALVVMFVGFTG